MDQRTSVAEEIGQRIPFKSSAQEALVGLMRTSDAVRRHFGVALAESGITLQQYNVLRILRGAGEEGLPTLEVAKRMIEHQPGVTRLIDRLIKKGLVDRCRGTQDRRKVVCSITPAGLSLLEAMEPVIGATDGLVGRALEPSEVDTFIELLDRLRAQIRAESAPADSTL